MRVLDVWAGALRGPVRGAPERVARPRLASPAARGRFLATPRGRTFTLLCLQMEHGKSLCTCRSDVAWSWPPCAAAATQTGERRSDLSCRASLSGFPRARPAAPSRSPSPPPRWALHHGRGRDDKAVNAVEAGRVEARLGHAGAQTRGYGAAQHPHQLHARAHTSALPSAYTVLLLGMSGRPDQHHRGRTCTPTQTCSPRAHSCVGRQPEGAAAGRAG